MEIPDYRNFALFVKQKSRYVLDAKRERFLEAVIEKTPERTVVLNETTILWRAQGVTEIGRSIPLELEDGLIDPLEDTLPCSEGRIIPYSDRATEGRVNPKGIPCLYLADDKETAMAETRPWVGSCVTVYSFETIRAVTLVNCCQERPPVKHRMKEWLAWRCINAAFSAPVSRTDDVAEYAPTQILAESFRKAGFDGIIYASGLGKGKNFALFDLEAAKPTKGFVYRVKKVVCEFEEVTTFENSSEASEGDTSDT